MASTTWIEPQDEASIASLAVSGPGLGGRAYIYAGLPFDLLTGRQACCVEMCGSDSMAVVPMLQASVLNLASHAGENLPDGAGDVDLDVNEMIEYDDENLENEELRETAGDEAVWWVQEVVDDAAANVFQAMSQT
ncbi:hypothetical protein NDU88_001947 [Pleurodeles waltl]|uniref:Uncharacterized protein n=1 Tax=Pleurodeles waltl TaxID=8319 RepID=A0AAV7U7V0_PLEWA|nr:hypothetical protein NDU88_001947 [Pleurodeles waltl]